MRWNGRFAHGSGRQQSAPHKAGGVSESQAILCLLGHSALDRQAYRALLTDRLGFVVQVECDFVPPNVWNALRRAPDLAFCFADLPRSDVRDALQMISRLSPQTRILVASSAIDPDVLQSWSTCVLHGFVVKSASPDELRAAIDTVLKGEPYFSPGIRTLLTGGNGRNAAGPHLSRRESELLPLLARGLTLRDAATSMSISYKTADSYRTSLLKKLGCRDRVELARYAIRERIIEA